MIHPSYNELYNAINGTAEDNPIVSSRYSVCIATAKRARQLISGAEPLATVKTTKYKPLSTAVEEIYEGKVKVLGDDEPVYDEFAAPEEAEETAEAPAEE